MAPPDLAAPLAELARRRPERAFRLHWVESVGSTMDVAASLVHDGATSGLLVVADRQTAGRGRRGRGWDSPPGAGLYVSLVWRPVAAPGVSPLVTLAAGVGVREGIGRATGLRPDLKWPNDLVVGGRKLGGILAEGHGLGTPSPALVVGVGLNLREAAHPPDVAAAATSLAAHTSGEIDRGRILAEVIEGLSDALDEVALNAGGILLAWRRAAPSAVGAAVEWDEEGTVRRGVTAGIDETGALFVTTAAGPARIVSATLRWHGLSGHTRDLQGR